MSHSRKRRAKKSRRCHSASEPKLVTARIQWPVADLDFHGSPVPEGVLDLLTTPHNKFEILDSGQISHRVDQECHYKCDANGRLVIAAGVVPAVKEMLEAEGYRVDCIDLVSPNPRLEPRDLPPIQRSPFTLSLTTHAHGQILLGRSVNWLRMVVECFSLFRSARFQVVMPSRARARDLAGQLQLELRQPDRVACAFGERFDDAPPQVVVTSEQSFQPHECDVIVFPDIQDATHREAQRRMLKASQHRTYAFRPAGLNMGRRLELEAAAAVGPIIYEEDRNGTVQDTPRGHFVRLLSDNNQQICPPTQAPAAHSRRSTTRRGKPTNQTQKRR